MSERLKKILQIVGFILIIVIIAWAIWAVFFRSEGEPIIPGTGPGGPGVGGFPEIGPGSGGIVVDPETGLPKYLVPEQPEPERGQPKRKFGRNAVKNGGQS